ncbi:MAG: hypothetical protein ACR2JH_09135 [Solirubrobacteraceae bacterium]
MTEPHEQPRPEEEERPIPGQGEGLTDDDASYPTSDPEAGPEVTPGPGGYEGRDPATDMPRVPSAPETQDE